MFSCFTLLANKNNYDYNVSYYDFEGPEEKIEIINVDKSMLISINIVLLVLILMLF